MSESIPPNAIILPKDQNDSQKYLAVSLEGDHLKLHLLKAANAFVRLDKKILPDLIDALIDLHNSEEYNK